MSPLDDEGFQIVPKGLDNSEIPPLADAIASAPTQRSRAGMRNAFRVQAVRSLAQDERLIVLAKRALGESVFPFRATLFDKSPTSNWLVVWHQDTALPLQQRREVSGWGPWSVKEGIVYAHAPASALEQILAIRVHLDESTAGNGPLRVLPRTHALGGLSDDSIHELVNRIPSIECCVPAGGLLLMRPLVVHASSKAMALPQRRVLHIEYASQKSFPGGLELLL